MIRVILVDDSPIALHILQHLLSFTPEIQVVGVASNGAEALKLIAATNPDVICTDYRMPVMDGLELTREVMRKYPRPILVISASLEPNSINIFQMLEAGAVDVYNKPTAVLDVDQKELSKDLASKIRIVAGVKVFSRLNPKTCSSASLPQTPLLSAPPDLRIIVIGASTGGPKAICKILSQLPADFPLPILCVQHISSGFLSDFVDWLKDSTALVVRQAAQNETPKAGCVYFAPENKHLLFDMKGCFNLSDLPACEGHRPSITLTMQATAEYFGAGTVGVLLTGMGSDGAKGIQDIAMAGGITLAQDEASCVVYGMPKAAVALGAVHHILALDKIAPALINLVNSSKKQPLPLLPKTRS